MVERATKRRKTLSKHNDDSQVNKGSQYTQQKAKLNIRQRAKLFEKTTIATKAPAADTKDKLRHLKGFSLEKINR